MQKYPTTSSRMLVFCMMIITCVGCDQTTKQLATTQLRQSAPHSYFGDTLRLQYAENPGGFLGAGSQLSPTARFWILTVFNSALLLSVAAAVLIPRQLSRASLCALTLILAGGIGNLIDRITNDGLVTDFMNIGLGPLRTGIFNVADVAISIGGVLLVYCLFQAPDPNFTRSQSAK